MTVSGSAAMVSSTDFASVTESYQRRCVVKVWTALTSQFIEEVLTPLMEVYEPQNIYNADETSLFYKSLSNHTMSFDSEEVHGSTYHQSKDRMSLFLCPYMNGSEKLNPVLIGKAAHPIALKKHGVMFKDLGIEYFWNQKG